MKGVQCSNWGSDPVQLPAMSVSALGGPLALVLDSCGLPLLCRCSPDPVSALGKMRPHSLPDKATEVFPAFTLCRLVSHIPLG